MGPVIKWNLVSQADQFLCLFSISSDGIRVLPNVIEVTFFFDCYLFGNFVGSTCSSGYP